MARYIELDKKKFARLRKEAQQFQDDIVCAVGTDFMETIAEAENRMIFDILNGLESEPTSDVVEVKHGKWNIEESQEHFNVVCQNCDKDFYVYKKGQYRIQNSNYCPNCGARMDGDTQ